MSSSNSRIDFSMVSDSVFLELCAAAIQKAKETQKGEKRK